MVCDFVLDRWDDAVDAEEVGIQFAHFVELSREDVVRVFALIGTVPRALSASADHGCCSDGVWSVGLRCGKLGSWNCLTGEMGWC